MAEVAGPVVAIALQGVWAILIALTGTYAQVVNYVVAMDSVFFGLTGALLTANFNPILAALSATHPLAWSFFFLNMAETVPLYFMFRWYLRNRGPLTFGSFIVICAIGDFLANFVQAIALSYAILKLPLFGIPSVVFLFAWQWGMAVIIGAPIGWYVYRSFSRAGVFS